MLMVDIIPVDKTGHIDIIHYQIIVSIIVQVTICRTIA